jgi:hypothetical protein
MYSSVAAHHNYSAGGDKLSNRQQQEQQEEQQDDQNNQQEDGGATRRHSGRHRRRHVSLTTRLFNYIKQHFHPEKDTGKRVCGGSVCCAEVQCYALLSCPGDFSGNPKCPNMIPKIESPNIYYSLVSLEENTAV